MTVPSLEETVAMRAYLAFYEAHRTAIMEQTFSSSVRGPEWKRILERASPEARAEAYALQKRAIAENDWEPYLAHLSTWGEWYAAAGVSYSAWVEFVSAHRARVIQQLTTTLVDDPQGLARSRVILQGLNALADRTVQWIGEAYLKALVARPEERYRLLFERSPLPMWTIDLDTLRFVMVNDAAVAHYGYAREEMLTMTLADIRPPEDVPELRTRVKTYAPGDKAQNAFRHRKKDGTLLWVEVRVNDYVEAGRNLRLVVITDITERLKAEQTLRQTEEQLRHAHKMEALGRLAGGVAHDFNNILTVVQTYACMLEENLDAADSRHDDAAEIRRASERATAITRQLLALSRHSIVAPRTVDPGALVEGFLPMLRRIVAKGVEIDARCGTARDILIDPGQLEQVLMNLAVNARDAMPAGGRLTIATREVDIDAETAAARGVDPGAYVELAVADTGSGIDAENQARIFDPFFTTKDAGKGTGLGLSIVHGIIAQAGGFITLYSERGRGSTFRVNLPVARSAVTVAEPSRVVAPKLLPPYRVLVVDDQDEVRTVAARVLREAGCQVLEASTGEEARRICVHHEERIDVVLLEVVLVDVRGETLVQQLRELRPALKFVPMSGYPAGALGAHGAAPPSLLAKPFSPSELRAAIARAAGPIEPGRTSEIPVVASGVRGLRRALVADDDDLMRQAVTRLLRKAGFDVVEVDSGSRAITALEMHAFDVVVSDVQMPDGGGLDLLRAVRRIDLDVPVILISGTPSVAAAAEAVEYGAFRYLTKPLDTPAFLKTVEHAARAHALARLRREAFNVTGSHGGAADRAGLEVRFEAALEGLWIAYQPIVHARTGALFGVEALMRSNEPSIPNPGALLDAATQLGRLPLVGRKVRALASAAVAERDDGLVLFVNLHPDDLLDVELVAGTSPLSQIANRVILEVTERAGLDTSPLLNERIARLRQLGFRLAVDDIGAGYSGLTSFTQLTPEVVKIDMSLVRDVHASTLKQRTIGALCELCRDVGTLVVVEGIETHEERETLEALGCDLFQGYLFGRPVRELPPPR